ncbi:MAG: hypothetical protein D4R64_04260 [Porphyromonadaceae bacterium]|nr:MAG: hypothetical protein D4R64_04260 [Porphyromonadaceae bacterium]
MKAKKKVVKLVSKTKVGKKVVIKKKEVLTQAGKAGITKTILKVNQGGKKMMKKDKKKGDMDHYHYVKDTLDMFNKGFHENYPWLDDSVFYVDEE